MPHLFFHFVARDEWVPDEAGHQCNDLPDAHRHAMRLISFVHLASPRVQDEKRWVIRIVDEYGRLALAVVVPRAPVRGRRQSDRQAYRGGADPTVS
jgi:hypothetical protein